MRRWITPAIIVTVAAVLLGVGAAQSSGPAPEVVASGRQLTTTTTTEPPPEGVTVVQIENGSFKPANLTIDLARTPIVRWENADDFEYAVVSRDRVDGERLFESDALPKGATFEFDFSTVDQGLYRYFAVRGAQTIPGLVDTRPAQ